MQITSIGHSPWLRTILGEIHPEKFLSAYFGKSFLYIPGPTDRFSELLSWSALNRLLETQQFTKHSLIIKKDGLDVPTESYLTEFTRLGRTTVQTRLAAKAITKELRDGATLIVNEIHKAAAAIGAMVEELERALDAKIAVNMYASMHEKHGFRQHYDTHDVLVLQIQGRKHWQIFGKRPVTPLAHEPFNRNEQPLTTPVWDGVITQGDALYLPRGLWHFAEPIGEPTLHLSVGIVRPTGFDVLQWVLQELNHSEHCRQHVPFMHAPSDDYLERLRLAVHEVLTKPDALASFYRNRLIGETVYPQPLWQPWSSPKFGLPWSAMENVMPPSDSAVIRLASTNALQVYEIADTGLLRFYVDGKPVAEFRERVLSLCEYLIEATPLTVREFISHFQGMFGEATLRAFLRDLVVQDIVVVSELELNERHYSVTVPTVETT